MKVPYVFQPGINLLSFVFSAGIGVLFGYFPARRAARHGPDRGAAARVAAGVGARRIRGARVSARQGAPVTDAGRLPPRAHRARVRPAAAWRRPAGRCRIRSTRAAPATATAWWCGRSWPAPAPGGSRVPGSVGACASAPRRSAPPTPGGRRWSAGCPGWRPGLRPWADAARSCARIGQRPVQAVDVVQVLQVVQDGAEAHRSASCADSRRTCVASTRRTMWCECTAGPVCIRPAACSSSFSACRVLAWYCATRGALSATTSARWRSGSCVVTPVGQNPVWQVCAWMQPTAIMKPRPSCTSRRPAPACAPCRTS
jgi:hypothetical protein